MVKRSEEDCTQIPFTTQTNKYSNEGYQVTGFSRHKYPISMHLSTFYNNKKMLQTDDDNK